MSTSYLSTRSLAMPRRYIVTDETGETAYVGFERYHADSAAPKTRIAVCSVEGECDVWIVDDEAGLNSLVEYYDIEFPGLFVDIHTFTKE